MSSILLQVASEHPTYKGMVLDHEARHRAYCERYRMDYGSCFLRNFSGWERVRLLRNVIRCYDHVFCLDADTFIADFGVNLHDALPDWASYAMTIHPYGWRQQKVFHAQTGVMMFRSDDYTMGFLDQVFLFADDEHWTCEQEVINLLLFDPYKLSNTPNYRHLNSDHQERLNILPARWNQTMQDCPFRAHTPIIAAFHGTSGPQGPTPEWRRQIMMEASLNYPY